MRKDERVLGVDIGSVALAAVEIAGDGSLLRQFYQPHGGDIPKTLARLDREFGLPQRKGRLQLAVSGRAEQTLRHELHLDSRLAAIRAAKEHYPEVRAVLQVGAEFFSLIRLDADGRYESVRTNSSCAAGTGGFLDQQAGRLNMADSAELSSVACANIDPPPLVATRCAVFAKTDLIHAQQEGYSLPAVAHGLCRGLARNLVDTLFKDDDLEGSILFTGGVSCNAAVVREVAELVPQEIVVDRYGPVQGALGAALSLLEMLPESDIDMPHSGVAVAVADSAAEDVTDSLSARYRAEHIDRTKFYPPLELHLSKYPDFTAYASYEQAIAGRPGQPVVEVDLYRPWGASLDAYIGIDIGSTSTKAVVTDLAGSVYGGFYTRTAGRPLEAVQAVFEAVRGAAEREGAELAIQGSATTGSGRKFIGGIIQADEVLDEISAHARAAYELNPEVDTILEIGGQDAKFTTLSKGRVTLSIMNSVCAAGTGSFIEEQAKRLGVGINEYAELAEGVAAPQVSDRCTVFMERDINHLLAEGHSTQEVLAAALHAVRENYLQKVAVENSIGSVVFFQGATAKNRTLVAAFEQRLGRPILVSPFCHLTGALGAALVLRDQAVVSDRFVGLSLADLHVPVRREVCSVCANHCKLSVAEVQGRSTAFGFLCGRDYDSEGYVSDNVSGFDLIRERDVIEQRLLRELPAAGAESNAVGPSGAGAGSEAAAGAERQAAAAVQPSTQRGPVIGLPTSLYMSEDRLYWQAFFKALGMRTSCGSAKARKQDIRRGKLLSGAEFCAPIGAVHGRVASLLEEAEYVFLPSYLERKPDREHNGASRKFCYYSQFAASLVQQAVESDRIIAPVAASRRFHLHSAAELYQAFAVLGPDRPGFARIVAALERAEELKVARAQALRQLYHEQSQWSSEAPDVVLLGRPYTVLQPELNKGIPRLFGKLGIRNFYQDMIPYDPDEVKAIAPLLSEINWSYGAQILEVAEVAARTPGLYPVLLTSFKCGPDSFIVEYLRRILDAHDKPYLILELDEHDSAVGYETRIEAAVRAFRNHQMMELQRRPGAQLAGSRQAAPQAAPSLDAQAYAGINPRYLRDLSKDKTLVLPNWDDYALPLIAAILKGHGYRCVLMRETAGSIRRSLRWNNGQCIPMNALVEGFADTLEAEGIAPEDALLWVPSAGFSCNIKLFAHHIQEILHRYGNGMEQAKVYLGQMSYIELSPLITANAYLAYMFSGLIRRIACRIRPYETEPGTTDAAVDWALSALAAAFEGDGRNKTELVREIMERVSSISYHHEVRRPKVALFGDVYVRDNPVFNQDVIGYIERNGGEVVTMPFHEFTRMTVDTYFRRWLHNGNLGRLLALKPMMSALALLERWYYRHFEAVIGEPQARFSEDAGELLSPYGVSMDHEGESQDNLLKAWYVSRQHPDLALFVQLNPGFCCAGLVTEAMSHKIKETTGVPVLSITYDGVGGLKNDAILPYLKYPSLRSAHPAQEPEVPGVAGL
ncbi:MAG: CoA activase [Spirochaetaceae bacterium]|nr:MAG: CoA activase [Spirochaetaceae bacterium]